MGVVRVLRFARGFLLVVSILNGVLGLICGLLLLARPDGSLMQMGALLPVIETFPLADVFFRDFLWIGIAMLLVLAIPNLIAATMLIRRKDNQYRATLSAAILLVLWCGFEMVYMFNVAAVGYLVVALISIVCSVVLTRVSTGEHA